MAALPVGCALREGLGTHSPSWQMGMPSFRCVVPGIGGERTLETDLEKVSLIETLLILPSLWQ